MTVTSISARFVDSHELEVAGQRARADAEATLAENAARAAESARKQRESLANRHLTGIEAELDRLWDETIENAPRSEAQLEPGPAKGRKRKGKQAAPNVPGWSPVIVAPQVRKSQYSVEDIRSRLGNDPAWIEKGILAIYARQTDDEQSNQATQHDNGIGFTGADAYLLSSFAQQIKRKLSWGLKLGGCLSEKQLTLARQKMPKYAAQLYSINRGKINQEDT